MLEVPLTDRLVKKRANGREWRMLGQRGQVEETFHPHIIVKCQMVMEKPNCVVSCVVCVQREAAGNRDVIITTIPT